MTRTIADWRALQADVDQRLEASRVPAPPKDPAAEKDEEAEKDEDDDDDFEDDDEDVDDDDDEKEENAAGDDAISPYWV